MDQKLRGPSSSESPRFGGHIVRLEVPILVQRLLIASNFARQSGGLAQGGSKPSKSKTFSQRERISASTSTAIQLGQRSNTIATPGVGQD
jgi:hypothetical protein